LGHTVNQPVVQFIDNGRTVFIVSAPAAVLNPIVAGWRRHLAGESSKLPSDIQLLEAPGLKMSGAGIGARYIQKAVP
jgi:hypothetical protein